jgi:hypothetical protein
MRSPVRPAQPRRGDTGRLNASGGSAAQPERKMGDPLETPTNPVSAMNALRRKMEAVADEFAQGKINRVQFNAMYKRYSEQRAIIEKLLERNPDSDAWRQVVSVKGQTGFLRTHYEAVPQFYLVYYHNNRKPIYMGGQNPDEGRLLSTLQGVWAMPNRPKVGLGRKALETGQWLILATGEYAATGVMFSLEPSIAQAKLVRDLHADFERANQAALARGWIVPERMVFPQRALLEES